MIELPDNIFLKPIKVEDQSFLINLMHRIYPQNYSHLWEDGGAWYVKTVYSLESLKKELSDPCSAYYFVKRKEEVVGILRVQIGIEYPGIIDQGVVRIHRIYLDNNVQGQGIGRLLINWAEKQAYHKGISLLVLEAMDTQEPALKFYRKMGFENAGNFSLEYDLMHKQYRGMYRMGKKLER